MLTLLDSTARVEKLTKRGATVTSHLVKAETKTTSSSGAAMTNSSDDTKLDVHLKDGFYRIFQTTTDDEDLDASLGGQDLQAKDYKVVMDSAAPVIGQFWKLTHQYGVKNGFTIVPVDQSAGDSKLGATTYNNSNLVRVKKSSCYPVWNVTCVERLHFGEDGKHGVINYFRILEAGTNRGWKTGDDKIVKIQDKTTTSKGNATSNEIYEFTLISPEPTTTISSTKALSVIASGADIVKKYYFGTEIAESKRPLYLSVQLETDARDQGWATSPERGLWSWFELAIFSKDNIPSDLQTVTNSQIKKDANGKALTWFSHSLPLSSTYAVQTGTIFGKDHEIWKHLGDGDYIGALGCAEHAQWECDARGGKLHFVELTLEADA